MSDTQSNPREEIIRTCEALFHHRQVVEGRILEIPTGNNKRNATASGYFNDWERLADGVLPYDSRQFGPPEGIYVTLNPVDSACLARACNRVAMYPKYTTTDKQITRRHWLAIDFDSRTKPAGVSATDAEVASAMEAAETASHWLEHECGWPPGLRAESGNGAHRLYRVDQPNDDPENDASRDKNLIRACLAALEEKFGTPAIKIDQSNVNASRIFTLYGTVKRKGDPLPDRPHRRSRLLPTNGTYPKFDNIVPVTQEQLEALAALASGRRCQPVRTRSNRKARPVGGHTTGVQLPPETGDFAVDLVAYIEAHEELEVTGTKDFDGDGTGYILRQCVFNPDHGGSSAAIGRAPNGSIWYKCQHDSCASKGWADVVEKLGPVGTTVTLLTHDGTPVEVDISGTEASGGKSKKKTRAASGKNGLDHEDPLDCARAFLAECCTAQEFSTLVHFAGSFYRWSESTGRYHELEIQEIRRELWLFLDNRLENYTRKRNVDEILDAMTALCACPTSTPVPSYLAPCAEHPPAVECAVTPTGILHLKTLQLYPNTPKLFTLASLPVVYDANAPEPTAWLEFLHQVWPNDPESIGTLQEWFGYCISADTSQQKAMLMQGPKRAGKGTVARVLSALLGRDAICAPTTSDLASHFGLEGFIGKQLAIISDARFIPRPETQLLVERVLCITGEDQLSIPRKHRKNITLQLGTRLLFLTNELPRLVDASGAFASRFIVLVFERSFYGAEDTQLFDQRLRPELSGILRWAMDGLHRLICRGRFIEPASSADAIREIEELGSPVKAFVRDWCLVGPEYEVAPSMLFKAWQAWCRANGRDHAGSVQSFGKDFLAAFSNVKRKRPQGEDGTRPYFYRGIRLTPEAELAAHAYRGPKLAV